MREGGRRGRSLEEIVGDRVRALREARALSQGQLARLARVSPSLIHALEHAARSTTIKVLGRVARALGVRAAELLAEEPTALPPTHDESLWRSLASNLRGRDARSLRAISRLIKFYDQELRRDGQGDRA